LELHVNIPVLIVRKNSLKYQPRYTDYIINWGCSKDWEFITHDKKAGHKLVVNKLDFFQQISYWNDKCFEGQEVNIPQWTDDGLVAANWGFTYLARTKLNGHSGQGIIIVEPDQDQPIAPLYVQYKKKRHEYRVHFFTNNKGHVTILDVTQKKKRKGFENVNTKIRNHQNGWVYCREDITEPDDLRTQALNTANATGLKFGAVDLIWNEKENKCYVLEVNTAPGLEGTTLQKYTQAFLQDLQ
jgi:hypothetical protein